MSFCGMLEGSQTSQAISTKMSHFKHVFIITLAVLILVFLLIGSPEFLFKIQSRQSEKNYK